LPDADLQRILAELRRKREELANVRFQSDGAERTRVVE